MLSKSVYRRWGLVLSTALLFFSCSTEKDAALNKGYHNMTARYNGYFNARVIMNEALESYRAGLNEDYTKILPLHPFPSTEDVNIIQEKYEKALEKSETVIHRHSMPSSATRNKSVEHCRWIDDNWFVIGVIHYTRREYVKAEEIFSFLDESPLYKDQERVHEARLWLAKTYIAQGRFPEAKRVLSNSETQMESAEEKEDKEKETKYQKERRKKQEKKDKKDGVKRPVPFPKQLKDDFELTMAEYYMAQEEYKKVIPHLEQGIELTKKKKKKARYRFVLAQIYASQGDGERAAYYFDKVVKSNAPYEMRFQAQINKALNATGGEDEIRKTLTKMIRDPKNEEYLDQIYFALAEMDMKAGDKPAAIENYSNSAFYSIKNDRQKGVSYLKLGDIFFNDQNYLSAQKYYDSCIQVLPETYETYDQVKGKADGLSELVFHYDTYVFEDSVQRIAKKSPEELEKYLEQQVKDMKEAEKKRKEEEQKRLLAQQNRVKNSGSNTGSGSKWYFYNQKVSSSGFTDFRANWGQRLLEDDWRRTNKTSYGNVDPDDPDAQDSLDLALNNDDTLSVDMLMADLPLTPEAMDSSNNKLLNSLYMLGIIYKEQLKEEGEAITYFSKVVDRNVEHPKVLSSLYQLYLIYNKKGNSQKERYAQQILNDYPDSEISKILKDPDYLEKKIEKDKEELNEYSACFDNYRLQRYNNVLAKCNDIIANDTANQYLKKYYLLKAFALGKKHPGNKAIIEEPLVTLYKMAPSSEEGLQAKIYLDKLSKGIDIVTPDTAKVEDQSPYIYDEEMQHYFVVIFPKDAGQIGRTENQLSNFCKEFFKSKQLKILKTIVGDDQLLVVRTFEKQQGANDFKLAFNSNTAKPTIGNMASKFDHFMINGENFTKVIQTSDLPSYLEFYKEKYP